MFTNTIIATINELETASSNPETAKSAAEKLGEELSAHIGKRVNLNKITKRDASILMFAFGSSDFTVREYSNTVARRMRSNRFEHGSWGAIV